MLVNNRFVILVIIVTLTYFATPCLGYHLLPTADGSLLRNRRQSDCSSPKVLCADGSCVPTYKVCDGTKDCLDGADEFNNCTNRNSVCPGLSLSNGQISVSGESYDFGTPVRNYALVKLTCNKNFALYPANALITCIDGAWNIAVPQCKMTCSPRISSLVDVTCKLDNKEVDCTEPLVEGTVAISKCKHFYSQTDNEIPISTCSGGSWDLPLIRCVPECGEPVSDGTPLIVNSKNAKKGKFPWHIGLYRFKDGKHEYLCGGSIITPLLIITAAHCLTDNNGTKYPAQEYFIGAGKYYSDYNSPDDKLAQKRQIKEFYIPPQYRGYHSNYAGDLAIAVLMKTLELSNLVQPVCIEWDNIKETQQLTSNNSGTVVGWGYVDPNKPSVSAELKQLDAPYIDIGQCLQVVPNNFVRWVTSDKFCAGFTNGSSVCKGDNGGGIVFGWKTNNRQRFYIRGLLSIGPIKKGTCDNFQYAMYTKVSIYKDFILRIISQNQVLDTMSSPTPALTNDFCPALSLPNGQINVLQQGYVFGTPIPNYTRVELTCNKNFALYPTNALISCLDGVWNITVPQCKMTCPPRISSFVDVTCKLDNKEVDCTKPPVEGTVAISKCKRFYSQTDNEIPTSTCFKGSWEPPLTQCVPECGELVSDGTIFIVNSESAKKGKFPWHIGLYRLMGGKHVYQCGGSIITPLLIITAAHCVTDYFGNKIPAEEYFIGAGKYYSDYNSPDDKLAQTRQIKEYYIPPQYKGYQANFAGDLAIAVLKRTLELSNLVQPVCIEWDNKIERQQLKANNSGTVVGWGYVDPNKLTPSPELKQLNAPYIDVEQCLQVVPQTFLRWVTPDKFCAGFTNGSSVCKGDSGGGMVFGWKTNNRQKFYIRGLVSAGPPNNGVCDNFQYGVYTRISFYRDFIHGIIGQNHVLD